MAKEKFLIVAVPQMIDCFGRFSETDNRLNLDAGTSDAANPYSWIEASFTIELRRCREATHLCSFTPSAYYVFLQNAFVGTPNAAWEYDGDPDGLEYESGGEWHGYGTYHDEYDPAFVCDSFTIDTVKDLDLRKPAARKSLSRRSDTEAEALELYARKVWNHAEEIAQEIGRNGGFWCDGLNVFEWRTRQRVKGLAAHLTA